MKVIDLANALLNRKRLREGKEYTSDNIQRMQGLHAEFEKIEGQIKRVINDSHYSLEEVAHEVGMLAETLGDLSQQTEGYDLSVAIEDAVEALNTAKQQVFGVELALRDTLKSLVNSIESEQSDLEWEEKYGRSADDEQVK